MNNSTISSVICINYITIYFSYNLENIMLYDFPKSMVKKFFIFVSSVIDVYNSQYYYLRHLLRSRECSYKPRMQLNLRITPFFISRENVALKYTLHIITADVFM